MSIDKKKHQVHSLILLDESGSMGSIKLMIIKGFNEIVETVRGVEKQFPEQEHFISFLTFNGLGQKTLLWREPVNKINTIDSKRYHPEASTPLYDAIGTGCIKLRKDLEAETEFNVLVTILTDGEENASKEYSGKAIKELIEELKLNRWAFTYIGTDHDVEKVARSISIHNSMTFLKNDSDMKIMFEKESRSRHSHSMRIRNHEDTNKDFYEDAGKN